MLKLLREIGGIETVGALRQALAEFPDEMPLGDIFGEAVKVEVLEDGERRAETRPVVMRNRAPQGAGLPGVAARH